jgi:hypothetical protein
MRTPASSTQNPNYNPHGELVKKTAGNFARHPELFCPMEMTQDKRDIGGSDHRIIGPSGHRAITPLDHRAITPLGYRAITPSVIGPLDHRAI